MVTRTNVYGERKLKMVKIDIASGTGTGGGVEIQYGFMTNVDDTAGSPLGHTEIPNTIPTNLVIGANSPKPARASKDGVSSFVATDKIGDARRAGWKIIKPARTRGTGFFASPPSNLPRGSSIGVYVLQGLIRYAWRMPAYQFNLLSTNDLSTLKIEIPNSRPDTRKLVYGASKPKPGKASKLISSTTGSGRNAQTTQKRVTTFYGFTANLGDGWTESAPPVEFA